MKLGKFFLVLFALALFSCSGNDVTDIETDAQDATRAVKDNVIPSVTGRWQLVRQGELDLQAAGIFVEFDAKGYVTCEYGVGSENYKKDIYGVNLEDDWIMADKKLSGHLKFPLCGENRFLGSIEGNQLVLLPDEGAYYIMDPTKYFVKVN